NRCTCEYTLPVRNRGRYASCFTARAELSNYHHPLHRTAKLVNEPKVPVWGDEYSARYPSDSGAWLPITARLAAFIGDENSYLRSRLPKGAAMLKRRRSESIQDRLTTFAQET